MRKFLQSLLIQLANLSIDYDQILKGKEILDAHQLLYRLYQALVKYTQLNLLLGICRYKYAVSSHHLNHS